MIARMLCRLGFHRSRVVGLTQYTRVPQRILRCERCGNEGVLI